MVVLLGISTAIAIVVPEPREPDQQEETADTGTTGSTGATGSTGDSGGNDGGEPDQGDPLGIDNSRPGMPIEVTVRPESKVDVVRAASGDRLVLTVFTDEPAIVEIEDLGLTQTTSRYAPAVFDVIVPDDPEVIEVTAFGDEKPLATINSEI